MLTDAAVLPAPVKTEPTRVDVLEHAKEIVLQQGAVTEYLNYWEDENGRQILANPRPETLADYRHCRVCVSGAAVLAAVRLGSPDTDPAKWIGRAYRALDQGTTYWPARIKDNPQEIVRILNLMIAAEVAA